MVGLLRDKSPSELRDYNQAQLRKRGVPNDLIQRFLDHRHLSPRHKTIITEAVIKLEGVAKVGAILRAALEAENEVEALFHESRAFLYLHWHKEEERLRFLAASRWLVVARTVSNKFIVLLPVDQLYWSEKLKRVLATLTRLAGFRAATARHLVVTGRVTRRGAEAIQKAGFHLRWGYEMPIPEMRDEGAASHPEGFMQPFKPKIELPDNLGGR